MEKDPNGKSMHEAGCKADANKTRLGLVLGGFARALELVGQIGTAGAAKYSDNGWTSVPDGVARYTDAMLRHLLAVMMGELIDKKSGQPHRAHVAWGALAVLELTLRDADAFARAHAPRPFVDADGHTCIYDPYPARFKITKVTGKGRRTKIRTVRVSGYDTDAELAAVPVMCNDSFKIAKQPKRKTKKGKK